MSESYAQEALELTRHLMRCHYCHQNSDKLQDYFSPEISWIGAGEDECLYDYDSIAAFFNASAGKLPACIIENEDYHIVFEQDPFCIIAGRCYIRTSDESQMILRVHQRVTFVYEKKGSRLEIIHIHASNPYSELADDSCFPAAVGRETYAYFKQLLKEKTSLIEMMTGAISGGLKGCRDDADYSFFYINDGLPRMLGYTREEFMERSKGSSLALIYPPDLPGVRQAAEQCFADGSPYQTEYRMSKKDGSLIWVMDSGKRCRDSNGENVINSMVTDISSLKDALSRLDLEKERYQIALGNISDCMFEHDIVRDVCWIYRNAPDGTPVQVTYTNFISHLKNSGYFDEESILRLKKAYETCQTSHIELVSKNPESPAHWILLQFRTFQDDAGRPCRSIGTIRNITKETRDKQILLEKAQLDSLTSIYNPVVFKEKVQSFLNSSNDTVSGSLLLLDLDDFKDINDRMGHLYGDAVLINVANCLKKICTPDGFAGRIGGDEFTLFLCGADAKQAKQAADTLIQSLRNLRKKNSKFIVSGSIGICTASAGTGQTYLSLFDAADKALYFIKGQGKDSYCHYDDLTDAQLRGAVSYTNTKRFPGIHETASSRLSVIVLEILRKSDDFDNAVSLIMEVIGNQYNLSRIAIVPNQNPKKKSPIAYQWTDQTTLEQINSERKLTAQDYFHFYSSFDITGSCILHADSMEGYSKTAREILIGDAQSVLYIAMYDNDGFTGTISFSDCVQKRNWTRNEIAVLEDITKIIASHMDRETALKYAHMMAEQYKNSDELTGLASLRKLKEQCQPLLGRTDRSYAVVYSDIKDFKYINKILGYAQGDEILKDFAQNLPRPSEPDSLCARVTGDQFVAFIAYTDREALIRSIKDTNRQFCRRQHQYYDNIYFRVRSGVYFIDSDCREISTAIDRANVARQAIAQFQKSQVLVYNDTVAEKAFRKNWMINHMDLALAHHEFQIYLQPLVDLKSHDVIGAEALIRWETPDGQTVHPDDFIKLFEENGFISKLDAYVLDSVCRRLHKADREQAPSVPVSINLSGLDIQQETVLHEIDTIVRSHKVAPSRLTFELTESVFLNNTDFAVEILQHLQSRGFKTAMDDFGSGYSLLNVIANIPADTIKIDRKFLLSCQQSPRGTAFFQQLVTMLRNMDYAVLCEGIETKKQLDLVTDLGCDFGQGFIFSKPVPMDQFFDDLKKNAR